MRKILIGLFVAMLVPVGVQAQGGRRGGGPPPQRMEMQNQNRRALERQILQRFVEQSGREMGLDARAKTELGRILDTTNDQRRTLAVESAQLRQKLVEALRDARTTDEQFRDILDEIEDLRGREHDLWKREQDQLSKTLTPRQRAQFMARWLRLQDSIRDLIEQRSGGDPMLDTAAFVEPLLPPGPPMIGRGG